MLKFAQLAIVPLVLLFAVVVVSGCDSAGTATTPSPAAKPAEAPKPAAAAPAPTTLPAAPGMNEKKPDAAAPVSTPAAPPATPAAAAPGVAIDAKTIVGTKWSAAGYTLAFQENGVVKINDSDEGTYKIDGNKLTIEAGGTTYDATIEGDKLMYEGAPLEKL